MKRKILLIFIILSLVISAFSVISVGAVNITYVSILNTIVGRDDVVFSHTVYDKPVPNNAANYCNKDNRITLNGWVGIVGGVKEYSVDILVDGVMVDCLYNGNSNFSVRTYDLRQDHQDYLNNNTNLDGGLCVSNGRYAITVDLSAYTDTTVTLNVYATPNTGGSDIHIVQVNTVYPYECTHPDFTSTYTPATSSTHIFKDVCTECGEVLNQDSESCSFYNGSCKFCTNQEAVVECSHAFIYEDYSSEYMIAEATCVSYAKYKKYCCYCEETFDENDPTYSSDIFYFYGTSLASHKIVNGSCSVCGIPCPHTHQFYEYEPITSSTHLIKPYCTDCGTYLETSEGLCSFSSGSDCACGNKYYEHVCRLTTVSGASYSICQICNKKVYCNHTNGAEEIILPYSNISHYWELKCIDCEAIYNAITTPVFCDFTESNTCECGNVKADDYVHTCVYSQSVMLDSCIVVAPSCVSYGRYKKSCSCGQTFNTNDPTYSSDIFYFAGDKIGDHSLTNGTCTYCGQIYNADVNNNFIFSPICIIGENVMRLDSIYYNEIAVISLNGRAKSDYSLAILGSAIIDTGVARYFVIVDDGLTRKKIELENEHDFCDFPTVTSRDVNSSGLGIFDYNHNCEFILEADLSDYAGTVVDLELYVVQNGDDVETKIFTINKVGVGVDVVDEEEKLDFDLLPAVAMIVLIVAVVLLLGGGKRRRR